MDGVNLTLKTEWLEQSFHGYLRLKTTTFIISVILIIFLGQNDNFLSYNH